MSIFYFDVGSTMVRVLHEGVVVWQEPSCIAVNRATDEVLTVGSAAYRLLGKTTEQVSVLFPIQNGVVSNQRAYQQLLQGVTKQFLTNQPIWDMLFGVQGTFAHLASITPQEQQIIRASLRQVGLGRLQLRDQILAAAAQLELVQKGGQSFCVIDIGGQVSEVAIITGHEVVAIRRLRWGGVHCTERIQEAIMQQYEAAVSWHTAEQVKRELGEVCADGSVKKHKLSVRGKNLLTQLGKTVVVSSEDLSPVCTQFAQEIVQAVQVVFSHAPAEVVTSCLEQGIFVVGGGAALKGLSGFLQKQLSAEVCIPTEPDLVVLRGLARTL